MEVLWPMLPNALPYWETKPLSYISHNLGHEGKNSLLSELIKQDLVASLNSGSGNRCQYYYGTFRIMISLTQKGLDKIPEIMRLIFAYINKLKEKRPQEYSFEEQRRTMKIKFSNQKRTDAESWS